MSRIPSTDQEERGESRPVPGVTGIVLAGGLGRRMGGIDKGLVPLRGKPLAEHALARLAAQVDDALISANQNLDRYAAFGVPVVPDTIAGFAGPLAGLHAGLHATKREFVVTVPCDSPFLPRDLVARLMRALVANAGEVAVARTFDQPHPVFALVRRTTLPHLAAFLAGGGRRVDAWHATLRAVGVRFDDEAAAFRNINTVDDLAAADRS